MKDSYINLMKGKVNDVDKNLLYPLLTWVSGEEKNSNITQIINRNLFYVDKDLSLILLYKGLKYKNFCRYPKTNKFDNEAYELIVYYLQKEYKYGQSDIKSMHKVILQKLNDKDFLEEFANRYGLDNKERKKLKLEPIKLTKQQTQEKKGFDLLNM